VKISILILSLLFLATSSHAAADAVRVVGDLKANGIHFGDNSTLYSSKDLLKNRGDLVAGTAYSAGDVVQSSGSSYVCTTATITSPPNVMYWSMLAATAEQGIQGPKGDTGETGPQGLKGDTGATGAQGTFGAGVNYQTVSYAALNSDNGKLITMNGTSLTLSLPSTPPSSIWYVAVKNLNVSGLTISSPVQINDVLTPITLGQNQIIQIWTNGVSYFASPTLVAGSGITLTPSSSGLKIEASPPALFKPTNFTASASWQYLLSTTAATTTKLTSGNYTVPEGVYYISIEAVGGAGGGGGCNTYWPGAGAGGGAGEYAGSYLAVMPGSTISITYGARGSAGTPCYTNANGCNAGSGGNTIVTYNSIEYVKAHGGQGGYFESGNPSSKGGAGGTSSTDLQHINGVTGSNGYTYSSTTPGVGGAGPNPTNTMSNIGGNGGVCNPSSSGTAGSAGFVVISYM
jgi:hypothetical protein